VRMPPCAPLPVYVGEGTVGPFTPLAPPRARRSAYTRSMSSGDITFAGIGCIGMKVDIQEAGAGLWGL